MTPRDDEAATGAALSIHILAINYAPDETGIAAFATARAEHLASQGHEVTICTGPPYYPAWRVPAEYRHRAFTSETRRGVRVLRCPMYVPSHVTTGRRMVHEASFVLSALARSLFRSRPDVLVVISPPLGLGLAAMALSKWWRTPFLFDVQDLQPDAALDLGMIRPGVFARCLYAVERVIYRHASRISTITEGIKARVTSKGVPGGKVQCLELWAEPDVFALERHSLDAELRRDLGIGDAFVALHVGNMGVKQGLDVIVEAAAQSASHVHYVLVGDGAERRRLEHRTTALGLRNVSIIPLLPRERFLRLLATADSCLVTQQRSVADIVFPSKVLTLLAAGKPVIASVAAQSEVARVVADAGAGIVVPPEDPTALAAAVAALSRDSARRDAAAMAGRAYAARRWQRSASLRRFESAIRSLVSAPR